MAVCCTRMARLNLWPIRLLYSCFHILRDAAMPPPRFERQEAEDQLSKLEEEQRRKAQQEENAKHLPQAKDPMEEMEEALGA